MAFQFDDANTEGLSLSVSVSLPISFSAIVEVDTAVTQTFVSIGDGTAGNQYHQLGVSSGNVFRARSRAGGTSSANHATALNTNTEYQVGGRWASANREPCLDGIVSGVNTTTRTPVLNNLTLGVLADSSPSEYLSGIMQEVGVWNIQLSNDDFAQLGDRVSPLMVRPESLIFYLPCFNTDYIDRMGGGTLTVNTQAPAAADHMRVIYPANSC